MTTPVDVVNVMWITLPFVFVSLLFNLRACVRNLTLHRAILATSCALAIICNTVVILMLGEYQGINVSLIYQLGVTTYNLSVWSARMYVCMRMAKLSPSPSISAAFDRFTYVSMALFALTMVTYCTSAVEFYRTHPAEIPAVTNETASICALAANLIFEITSIYLHVKSLRMFAASNSTGLKLYILSFSTLTAVVFGLIQNFPQVAGDVLLVLMMAGLQVAVLPASLILGEVVAKQIGRRSGRPVNTSSNSQSVLTNRSTDRFKTTTSTSSLAKETPIRQNATLVQPSI